VKSRSHQHKLQGNGVRYRASYFNGCMRRADGNNEVAFGNQSVDRADIIESTYAATALPISPSAAIRPSNMSSDASLCFSFARMGSGFPLAVRGGVETPKCPFANLPETQAGRWGDVLTAAKMKDCRWLKPVLLGKFEFVEWTPDKHLRHSRFVGLSSDLYFDEILRHAPCP
jgi:hypothetical protein